MTSRWRNHPAYLSLALIVLSLQEIQFKETISHFPTCHSVKFQKVIFLANVGEIHVPGCQETKVLFLIILGCLNERRWMCIWNPLKPPEKTWIKMVRMKRKSRDRIICSCLFLQPPFQIRSRSTCSNELNKLLAERQDWLAVASPNVLLFVFPRPEQAKGTNLITWPTEQMLWVPSPQSVAKCFS